jgi:hypothetical protein
LERLEARLNPTEMEVLQIVLTRFDKPDRITEVKRLSPEPRARP